MKEKSYLFETERLKAREFESGDKIFLSPFKEDPAQLKYMMFRLASDKEIDEFMDYALGQASEKPRKEYHLALEEKESGTFVGSVALMIEKKANTSAELGYWFHRGCWGKGYATEASLEMIRFGFGEAKLHRIWGECHTANKASARVMEKCGMKLEGEIREHVWFGDHYRSSYLYSILENEFT